MEDFGLGGITVSAGAASNPRADPQGQSQTFAFDVTHGLQTGNLAVGVRANAAEDAAGNGNEAASHSIEVDLTQPAPQLATDASSPTNVQSVTFRVDFGEPIDPTIFATQDISVSSGAASGIATSDNQTFTFAASGYAEGALTVYIQAGAVEDRAGNANPESNRVVTEIDTTAPG